MKKSSDWSSRPSPSDSPSISSSDLRGLAVSRRMRWSGSLYIVLRRSRQMALKFRARRSEVAAMGDGAVTVDGNDNIFITDSIGKSIRERHQRTW